MSKKEIDKIYDAYFKRVYFYVNRIIGDIASNEDIEECVSDVFLSIWKEYEKYDYRRGSFDTFINVKTRSISLNYRKKLINLNNRYKGGEIELSHIPNKEFLNTESKVIDNEDKEFILSQIKNFKEPNKTYFYLRYFMNYDIKTIAIMFNTTISSVDNRLYRCRLSLKKSLKKESV